MVTYAICNITGAFEQLVFGALWSADAAEISIVHKATSRAGIHSRKEDLLFAEV
jgi:hypothetical protein